MLAANRASDAAKWTSHASSMLSDRRSNAGPVSYTSDGHTARAGRGGARTVDQGVGGAGSSSGGGANSLAKPGALAQPENGKAKAVNGGGQASASATGDDVIVIHVCDDNRRINRDFYCSRDLLLTHMTYFTPYLADERRFEDIDISVHCDVHIFEWLMEYIHQPAKPPTLDPGSVISVLISADFLQMKKLADHCIEYLRGALPEVLRLPIDLSCVSDPLLTQVGSAPELPSVPVHAKCELTVHAPRCFVCAAGVSDGRGGDREAA